MKLKAIIAISISLLLLATATPTFGGPTDDIIVTLTPSGTVNITVTPPTWNGEGASIGQTGTSGGTAFTLDNSGTVQVDVTINATNTTAWTLDTSTGHNKFRLQWFQQGTQGSRASQESGASSDFVTKDPTFYEMAQTFKFTTTTYITDIQLYGYKSGSPSPVYLEIRNTTGTPKKPVSSGYLARKAMTIDSSWGDEDWHANTTFDSAVKCEANVDYCFVIWTTHTNSIYLYYSTSNLYPNGHYCKTTNGEANWVAQTGSDMRFRMFGYNLTETNILQPPSTFINNFAYNQDMDFGLKVSMPTSTSTNANQTTTITFSATAD